MNAPKPLALLLPIFAAACATPGGTVDPKLEQPRFDVLHADNLLEVRRYAPYLAASATVKGGYDAASRAGFRLVAGYIFGKNEKHSTIEMTAPVAAVPVSDGTKIAMTAPVNAVPTGDAWKISFMMPSEYARETLPRPIDPQVQIEEVPAQCTAVIRFNGLTTENTLNVKTEALRAWMNTRGLSEAGTPVVSRYNDPFTLPWRRRNEVQIPIAPESCG